jgi:hypothetical protein
MLIEAPTSALLGEEKDADELFVTEYVRPRFEKEAPNSNWVE